MKKTRGDRSLKNVKLQVAGMACRGCAENVKSALGRVAGVERVEVSLRDEDAVVLAADGVDPEGLIAAVEGAGYRATVTGAA